MPPRRRKQRGGRRRLRGESAPPDGLAPYMGAIRVRWLTLARGAGAALAALLAVQAVPALLRPPPPEPLAPDIGLPAIAPSKPVVRFAGVGRLSPARALPAGSRADRDSPQAAGLARPTTPPAPPAKAPTTTPHSVPAPAPAAAPAAPAPPISAPAPAPPPGDGSVEFMPH